MEPSDLDDGREHLDPESRTTEKPLKALNYVLNQFVGDYLDLGAGSWLISGTAYGFKRYGSDPPFGNIETSFKIQYTAPTDILDISIGSCEWTGQNASSPSSPMQLASDVSVPKIALIARDYIRFSCINFTKGNYFTFQP